MSKASTRQRPVRPTGAARRRAEVQRRKRNRLLFGASAAAVVVLVGALVGLHVASGSSAPGSAGTSGSGSSGASLPVGTSAPDGAFTMLDGKTETVAALQGKPALIWFVATWCSSCQAGTQALAQNVATLASDGVRVDEIELYQDLGQSGPSIGAFGKTLAGSAFSNPDWSFGTSSAGLTRTYDPQSYLDIYYLINAKGKITYANSSPGSTMPQLLSAAKALA